MKKGMTFEAAMERLEEIAGLLENGTQSLEQSLKLFEEGTKLAADCKNVLEKAEMKISTFQEEITSEQEEKHEG